MTITTDPSVLSDTTATSIPVFAQPPAPPTRPRQCGDQEQRALAVLATIVNLFDHVDKALDDGDGHRASQLVDVARHATQEHLNFALAEDLLTAHGVTATAVSRVHEVLTDLGPPRAFARRVIPAPRRAPTGRHTASTSARPEDRTA